MSLAALSTDIIDDLTERMGEQTVVPLAGSRVKSAIQCILVHGLRIDDIRDAFDTVEPLECGQEHLPSIRLAASGRTDHHETVLNLLNLVELENLRDPAFALYEPLLHADLADLFAKGIEVDRDIINAGEHIRKQTCKQRHIVCNKFGNDGLGDTLDEDDLLGSAVG